jgi:glycoprotein-N-acetylgalactosamine 3-beta-galactosyltransferase
MENVHIIAGNSRDLNGNERFFSYQPEFVLSPTLLATQPWLEQFLYYQKNVGINSASDTAISFHYVIPVEMYILDYLLYHIHPYGVVGKTDVQLPKKISISELLKTLNLNKSTVPVTWNVTAEAGDYDYGYRFRYQSEDLENK